MTLTEREKELILNFIKATLYDLSQTKKRLGELINPEETNKNKRQRRLYCERLQKVNNDISELEALIKKVSEE